MEVASHRRTGSVGPRVERSIEMEEGRLVMQKLAITIREAAAATSLSTHTIRKYIRLGQIKVYRVGRRVLIPIESLEELLGITSPQTPGDLADVGGIQ